MPDVLVLGARAPAALEIARRFRRDGRATAMVADSVSCRLSGWSNAVGASEPIAGPRFDAARFAADLARIVAQRRIDLVVPTCEEAFWLSRYRGALPASVRVLVDEFDKLRELHSKLRFLALARDCGAHVPDSAAVRDLDEARSWAAGRPLVLKPEYSRFGVHVRLYPQGMPADAAPLALAQTWVAQRFHAGTELCSYSVADRGRLLAHSVYRPAYRLSRSSSFYFEPAPNATIRGFVERFVAKIGYTGQISFDWIVGDDGSATVLECNPRATSGVHLFGAGDDLPAALLGADIACVDARPPRPRMLAPVMLGAGLAQALAQGRARAWLRDWRRADDVLSVPGDRLPPLGGLADLGAYAASALHRGGGLREAATRDIEWDGEELPDL
ncbi:ATP-grasp domain-containing protein [Lysobacter enzymogenes]|uniref:ATP-grasp domain-containing protein n=1 Tax=Lysobacter enzymogenes TaxID=69 RepID=A0A3N2RBY3_LYSEN|nr:ATP-grasp domain-containing protein [Lysobacter enzymogenes]ROU04969.1 ATP-grasp domain-containing protein [Lysobacter enzymogenes]